MASKLSKVFDNISTTITCWTGSSTAFITAFAIILFWGLTGPLFDYSDTWQLVIHTGTTIITFLMVFIIQKSQNKDSKAIQVKLNELIAASKSASNRMVDIEDLTEDELNVLHKFYQKLSDESEADQDIHHSHSIDNAQKLQDRKNGIKTSKSDVCRSTITLGINKSVLSADTSYTRVLNYWRNTLNSYQDGGNNVRTFDPDYENDRSYIFAY